MAHIAAGSHPINVICKIKQRNPDNILPLKKKDNQGTKIAIRIIMCILFIYIKVTKIDKHNNIKSKNRFTFVTSNKVPVNAGQTHLTFLV